MRLSAVERRYTKNRFHGKQIAKIKSEFPEFYAGITLKSIIIKYFFTSSQIIASPKGRT